MTPGRLVAAFLMIIVLLGGTLIALSRPPGPFPPDDRPLTPLAIGPEPLRLVAMGTSLTANYAWPEEVALRLADCLEHPVTATRIAEAGASSDWGLRQVPSLADLRADIILVEFSINDADLRSRMSPHASKRNHRLLVADLRARAPEAEIVLMTMNPARGLRALLRPRLARYYDIYREVGHAEAIGVLDLFPRWLALSPPAAFTDGAHPTDGAASRLIVPALAGYIAAAAGHRCTE